MPMSIWRRANLGDMEPVDMSLTMADGSSTKATGILDDVPVRVGRYFVPDDFVILDMKEDPLVPIILGRPFLATVGAKFDVINGKVTFEIGEDKVEFHFNKALNELDALAILKLEESAKRKREELESTKEEEVPLRDHAMVNVQVHEEPRDRDSPPSHEEYPTLYPFDVGDSCICLSDLKEDLGDSYMCLSDLKNDLSYNDFESPRNSLDVFNVGDNGQDVKDQEVQANALKDKGEGELECHA